MAFFAYLLKCMDASFYAGHTDDLAKRLGEHQSGACGGYTASRLPVELVWSQEFSTREEALAAEQQIKGWSRKKKEALVRGDWVDLSALAKGKHRHQRLGAAVLHASTSEALPPTLSTNGVPCEELPPDNGSPALVRASSVHHEPFDATSVRHELFDTYPVRPERSEAKSKGNGIDAQGRLPAGTSKAE